MISSLSRIEVDWKDDDAVKVIKEIQKITEDLKKLEAISIGEIKAVIFKYNHALDSFRLCLGLSQDQFVNNLSDFARRKGTSISGDFKKIRDECKAYADLIANILIDDFDLGTQLIKGMNKNWNFNDILIDRYKFSRGRAIAAQKRGKDLEDFVEKELGELGFVRDRNLSVRRNFYFDSLGINAKCDFAIPSRKNPRIVIEAKAYEATGSKQTDILGDVKKIIEAIPKDMDCEFFMVTDGIGWHRRKSDLKKLIDMVNQKEISMLYTKKTLHKMCERIKSYNLTRIGQQQIDKYS